MMPLPRTPLAPTLSGLSNKPEPEPNKPSDSHVAARARVVPLRRARVFFGVKSSCVTINKKNSLETFPKTK